MKTNESGYKGVCNMGDDCETPHLQLLYLTSTASKSEQPLQVYGEK